MNDIDLFSSVEPKTCATCGQCIPSRLCSTGHFCALSLRDVRPTDSACNMHKEAVNARTAY